MRSAQPAMSAGRELPRKAQTACSGAVTGWLPQALGAGGAQRQDAQASSYTAGRGAGGAGRSPAVASAPVQGRGGKGFVKVGRQQALHVSM
mmetsp:Transcript_70677/g.219223  ORF Transcript_70677/g.219223 Transcript_70677/m.219223 type:complete len:91 (+) Transcript_70677:980-1252(+)